MYAKDHFKFSHLYKRDYALPASTCVNIAGHDKIQIDVKSPKSTIQLLPGMQAIYEIPAPTDSEYTYMALEVDVNQLCEVIKTLEKDNVQVLFIHDY